ncbi:EthD domain-containing protein [Zoogloea sp.]|uniref:EthD domain-containing protein n=1 Tax=Zoogloea sp. TaxID=49181 RepID=UPI0035B1B686
MDALKVVSFLHRRADFSQARFSEYWRTTHKDHALKLVEAGFFRGYIQNHALDWQPEGLARMADGAPELWIDDVAALSRLVDSREYREGAGPDEACFMTPPAIACVARERLIDGRRRDALDGAVKLMLVWQRDPALSRDSFTRLWLAGDGASLLPGARPLRLTRQAVEAPDDVSTAFDGVECSWWPDVRSLQAAWAQRAAEAGRGLVAPGSLRGLLVREEVVLAPATEQ